MSETFEKFPEILLVDATYKLFDVRILICLFWLMKLRQPLNLSLMFSKNNESFSKNPAVMADKDFNEG